MFALSYAHLPFCSLALSGSLFARLYAQVDLRMILSNVLLDLSDCLSPFYTFHRLSCACVSSLLFPLFLSAHCSLHSFFSSHRTFHGGLSNRKRILLSTFFYESLHAHRRHSTHPSSSWSIRRWSLSAVWVGQAARALDHARLAPVPRAQPHCHLQVRDEANGNQGRGLKPTAALPPRRKGRRLGER